MLLDGIALAPPADPAFQERVRDRYVCAIEHLQNAIAMREFAIAHNNLLKVERPEHAETADNRIIEAEIALVWLRDELEILRSQFRHVDASLDQARRAHRHLRLVGD